MVGTASKFRQIRIELVVELGERITLLLLVRCKVLILSLIHISEPTRRS